MSTLPAVFTAMLPVQLLESDKIWFLKVLCGYIEAMFESTASRTISYSAPGILAAL
jgi:hypothetical protein